MCSRWIRETDEDLTMADGPAESEDDGSRSVQLAGW